MKTSLFKPKAIITAFQKALIRQVYTPDEQGYADYVLGQGNFENVPPWAISQGRRWDKEKGCMIVTRRINRDLFDPEP